MIEEVKINLEGDVSPSKVITNQKTHTLSNLTSIISGLNEDSEKYCLVINIVNKNSFQYHSSLEKQIRLLLESLTRREQEIFDLAIQGLSSKLIANKLYITVETVKTHRKNIVSKAGVKKIEEIKDWLLKMKWLES